MLFSSNYFLLSDSGSNNYSTGYGKKSKTIHMLLINSWLHKKEATARKVEQEAA